jgi:hypothetical protein
MRSRPWEGLIDAFAPRLVQQSGVQDQGADMTTRTTHRSSTGTRLYAVRNAKGQFKDIQTFKRAHTQDVKRKSRQEKQKH